jgi:hypothetical protein
MPISQVSHAGPSPEKVSIANLYAGRGKTRRSERLLMEVTMTDITYAKAAVPASARETARKSLWRLMYEAMVEARKREAERIVRGYWLS